MTDLDTALRAADFHVPDAAKVIREHLERKDKQRAEWASKVGGLQSTNLELLSKVNDLVAGIASVYEEIPALPVTPETCELATDTFVRFCNRFCKEINAHLDRNRAND